jgi:ecdysteroid 25-hydroxylase CYP302A1
LPKYCPDPDTFLPERWLKGHDLYQGLHPYLSLPFGFGPRMCIGRRVAEQSLQVLMIKLIEKFEITWAADHPDMDAISYLINQPDRPVKLAFSRI